MPKVDLEIKDIQFHCSYLTIEDYAGGWYRISESDKPIHGFNNLKKLNEKLKNEKSIANNQKAQQKYGYLRSTSEWGENQGSRQESRRTNQIDEQTGSGFDFGAEESRRVGESLRALREQQSSTQQSIIGLVSSVRDSEGSSEKVVREELEPTTIEVRPTQVQSE